MPATLKLAPKGVDIWVKKNMSETEAPKILDLDNMTIEGAKQYIEEEDFNLADLILTMIYYEKGMKSVVNLLKDYKLSCDYKASIVPIGEENPIEGTYLKVLRLEDVVFVSMYANSIQGELPVVVREREEVLNVTFDIDSDQGWTVENCRVSGMEQSFNGKLVDAAVVLLARHVLLLTVANRIGRKTA